MYPINIEQTNDMLVATGEIEINIKIKTYILCS